MIVPSISIKACFICTSSFFSPFYTMINWNSISSQLSYFCIGRIVTGYWLIDGMMNCQFLGCMKLTTSSSVQHGYQKSKFFASYLSSNISYHDTLHKNLHRIVHKIQMPIYTILNAIFFYGCYPCLLLGRYIPHKTALCFLLFEYLPCWKHTNEKKRIKNWSFFFWQKILYDVSGNENTVQYK